MDYLTKSKLAIRLGIQSKELDKRISDLGWTNASDGSLTQLGRDKGAKIWSNPEGREYIVWPVNLFDKSSGAMSEPEGLIHLDYFEAASERTEGEEYIAEYFDEIGIEYREQHPIEGLEDKYAAYRLADFYLPKYKVMLEFAGRWNMSEEERTRYRNKKQVYEANKVPCIWIYPDNLGVLHYIFHKRLETVLGIHGLENELRLYRLSQYWREDYRNLIGLGIGIFTLFYISTPWTQNEGWVWFSVAVIAYNLYYLISDLNLILRKGRSIAISRLNKWED